MSADHVEIWMQKPPAPIIEMDNMAQEHTPKKNLEKVGPSDMLLMGMMAWMQEGLVLDWVHPGREEEEKEKEGNNMGGDPHD